MSDEASRIYPEKDLRVRKFYDRVSMRSPSYAPKERADGYEPEFRPYLLALSMDFELITQWRALCNEQSAHALEDQIRLAKQVLGESINL